MASESEQKVQPARSLVVVAVKRYNDSSLGKKKLKQMKPAESVYETQHSTSLKKGMVLYQSEAGNEVVDSLAQPISLTVDGDGTQEMKVKVNVNAGV